jgi:hypothetical protein
MDFDTSLATFQRNVLNSRRLAPLKLAVGLMMGWTCRIVSSKVGPGN